MSSSATTIDDLPPELISELFKHLHLKDLAACSLVNKRWHSIYSSFKVDSLVAISNDEFEFTKWTYLNRNTEESELYRLNTFSRLLDKPLLSNLKHLTLCCYDFEFDLNELNRFSHLVHLQLDIDGLFREILNLALPKLKVLAFRYPNVRCPVSIDCPALSVLTYRGEPADANLLDVKQPETIRKLETDMVGAKLAPFKNVYCLVTREFEVICKDTLLLLPNLKELRYNVAIYDHLRKYTGVGILDRMKRTLREFLDDVKALRRSDFRFRFAGLQMTKTTLNEVNFGLRAFEDYELVFNEYVYMRNYQLIDPDATLDFISEVNYSELMENVIEEFPGDFFKKFTNIVKVFVYSEIVPDEGHFLWFLRSLRPLRKLELDSSSLSQEFYDLLPTSARSLFELILRGVNEDELQLNFDFLGKFVCFSELFIHRHLTFESCTSLARWLDKLDGVCLFYFRVKENGFFLRKSRGIKECQVGGERIDHRFGTENPDEIVRFFERLWNTPE